MTLSLWHISTELHNILHFKYCTYPHTQRLLMYQLQLEINYFSFNTGRREKIYRQSKFYDCNNEFYARGERFIHVNTSAYIFGFSYYLLEMKHKSFHEKFFACPIWLRIGETVPKLCYKSNSNMRNIKTFYFHISTSSIERFRASFSI